MAQWDGMGDVGAARYEPALLPPCPTISALSYSKCQRSIHSISEIQHFKSLFLFDNRYLYLSNVYPVVKIHKDITKDNFIHLWQHLQLIEGFLNN